MGTAGQEINIQSTAVIVKKQAPVSARPTSLSVAVFQPQPNVFYSLEATARLAGISLRGLLIYCRAGLVRPVVQPPYGVWEFSEEAVYTVRRIEQMRTGSDLVWLKTLVDLLDEVADLRAELRFLRQP